MAEDARESMALSAADAGYYVRHIDAISALDRVKGYKRRTLDLLEVVPGQRILDVGCGAGDETRALAELVDPGGEAVGIDVSEAMVAEARRRAASGRAARFELADAEQLPFPDGHFDGCRADRVLQHVRDAESAMAEMARVVKTGGRVVLAEPDWETYIVDAPDRAVTRRILNARCDRFSEGWIGRGLPRLLRAAGLEVSAVLPMVAVQTRFAEADTVGLLRASAARAAADGVVSRAEADAWVGSLEQADHKGHFLAAGTLFVVVGRKP